MELKEKIIKLKQFGCNIVIKDPTFFKPPNVYELMVDSDICDSELEKLIDDKLEWFVDRKWLKYNREINNNNNNNLDICPFCNSYEFKYNDSSTNVKSEYCEYKYYSNIHSYNRSPVLHCKNFNSYE